MYHAERRTGDQKSRLNVIECRIETVKANIAPAGTPFLSLDPIELPKPLMSIYMAFWLNRCLTACVTGAGADGRTCPSGKG